MSLRNQLEQQGNFLFRWRSFLPLVCLPLLGAGVATMKWPFGSLAVHEVWEFACLALSFAGLSIRVIVVGHAPEHTSGRNTKSQIAETLNTTGVYSVVRHPLYLGNFLIGFGVVLVPFEWWLALIYCLAFWLYYERIMIAEEGFLIARFGSEFDQWARDTPAFVPRLSQWQPAAYSFSFRNVLKREYTGLLVIVLFHSSIELAEFWFIEDRLIFEPIWACLIVVTLATYMILRMLKKRTEILHVPGR